MTTRRQFVTVMPLAGALVLQARTAQAQAAVDPKDPQATALGYVADATKADKAKFPRYADGQHCGNCQLFGGGAAATGPCPLFAGKVVANKGWCSAWAKKA